MSLIPITVAGIPSMHVCFDFIDELLAQPDMEKRIFAICLLAQLAQQYPVVRAFGRARLCLDTLTTLLDVLPINASLQMFSQCVESLVVIATTFPMLANSITGLLNQVAMMAASKAAPLSADNQHEILETQLINKIKKCYSDGLAGTDRHVS